jgi:hypothetical protein
MLPFRDDALSQTAKLLFTSVFELGSSHVVSALMVKHHKRHEIAIDVARRIGRQTKRTKNWADGWLSKLRADQRAAGAELAILVSTALPKSVETFGYVDGIWVTDFRYALPLALALRQSLIEVGAVRQAHDGQNTKMELIYQYLTGPKFRHRVEAIVEKFSEMKDDLDKERKAMTRLWAKREAQIRGVIGSTVGMYGDLQGIAGKALQEIDGLELPLIEAQVEVTSHIS